MKTGFLSVLLFVLVVTLSAQNPGAICRQVEKGNFRRVEHYVKREVRKVKHGITFDNGPGSGMQVNHEAGLDTILNHLLQCPCVEDAYRDKCQMKIAIYPGWSVIGVEFRTGRGTVEKCFHIQEGTTGTFNLFRWRFPLFRSRNILVYKKMYECRGFISEQRKLCEGN